MSLDGATDLTPSDWCALKFGPRSCAYRAIRRTFAAFLVFFLLLGMCGHASAGVLRIVDWNIEDDIDGATTPLPGFNTVLQGMGNEIIAGDAQPIDILTLEETTSNTTTVQPILNMLNGDYAGANYQMSPYQATESGNDPTEGNGPNALVYNANTVQLLASVGVGTPEGSTNGGTEVTITGTGFESGSTVTIGSAATGVEFKSSTEIVAKTAAHAAGAAA